MHEFLFCESCKHIHIIIILHMNCSHLFLSPTKCSFQHAFPSRSHETMINGKSWKYDNILSINHINIKLSFNIISLYFSAWFFTSDLSKIQSKAEVHEKITFKLDFYLFFLDIPQTAIQTTTNPPPVLNPSPKTTRPSLTTSTISSSSSSLNKIYNKNKNNNKDMTISKWSVYFN